MSSLRYTLFTWVTVIVMVFLVSGLSACVVAPAPAVPAAEEPASEKVLVAGVSNQYGETLDWPDLPVPGALGDHFSRPGHYDYRTWI